MHEVRQQWKEKENRIRQRRVKKKRDKRSPKFTRKDTTVLKWFLCSQNCFLPSCCFMYKTASRVLQSWIFKAEEALLHTLSIIWRILYHTPSCTIFLFNEMSYVTRNKKRLLSLSLLQISRMLVEKWYQVSCSDVPLAKDNHLYKSSHNQHVSFFWFCIISMLKFTCC